MYTQISNARATESPSYAKPGSYDGLSQIDIHGFCKEVEELKRKTYQRISTDDFRHLKKIERYGRLSALLGYSTAWIIPNPITAFLLSLAQFTRWLLAHHITHRGYDRVPGIPERYTSRGFARGWRRFIDWFDWLHPEAWDYEHNILHHYHTGEAADPDLAERHLDFIRKLKAPLFVKYLMIAVAACTWKFIYYAPNTLSVLDPETNKRLRHEHIVYLTFRNIFDFRSAQVRRLWSSCYLPYAGWNFVAIPLLFLPLGSTAAIYVLINKLIAEAMTNVHAFLVIGPNHTADDLYRYSFHYQKKEEFYVTQVLGSANYRCGTEFVDYMSIWLNYQIEHHIFPDLPMLKYREVQPEVKALCERYGVTYRQASIFKRFGKTLDICVGKTSMRELQQFPQFQAAAPSERVPNAALEPVAPSEFGQAMT